MTKHDNKTLHKNKDKVIDYWQKSASQMQREDSVFELREKMIFDHTWITTVKAILETADIGKDDRVLDVGCGWGRIISGIKTFIPGARVVGVDTNQMRLDMARDILEELSLGDGVELVCGDADNMDFDENSFDTVVSARLLQYVPNPVHTIREYSRVVKVGGTIAVTVPNKFNPWRYLRYGRVLYTPSEVRNWFTENGLSDVRCRTIGFIPTFRRFHWRSKMLYIERLQNIPVLNKFGGLVLCSGMKI